MLVEDGQRPCVDGDAPLAQSLLALADARKNQRVIDDEVGGSNTTGTTSLGVARKRAVPLSSNFRAHSSRVGPASGTASTP